MALEVYVDQERCTGCGRCYNRMCPDVFWGSDVAPDGKRIGKSQPRPAFRTGTAVDRGTIPSYLHRCADLAADMCPQYAIFVG